MNYREVNQYSLICDARDILASHIKMGDDLLYALEDAIVAFSEFALNEVRAHLKATIQRPNESDGTLEDAITYKIEDMARYTRIGIGDKEYMGKAAKYWRLINDGGPISSNYVPGFFVDETGQRVRFDSNKVPLAIGDTSNDKFIWTKGQKGSYLMVHNEIKPHRFFERGALSIEPHIDRYFGNSVLRKASLWI